MQAQYSPRDESRFWSKVARSDSVGDCWLWRAGRSGDGYGSFFVKNTTVRAHRMAWEIANGPIPAGMCILHRCDTPLCCNPTHLWCDTADANTRDMVAKGRHARGATHGFVQHPEYVPRGDRNGARTHPERLARGERHPRARLTAEIVRDIRRASRSNGTGTAELAGRYGVSRNAVYCVLHGKTWAHVQ